MAAGRSDTTYVADSRPPTRCACSFEQRSFADRLCACSSRRQRKNGHDANTGDGVFSAVISCCCRGGPPYASPSGSSLRARAAAHLLPRGGDGPFPANHTAADRRAADEDVVVWLFTTSAVSCWRCTGVIDAGKCAASAIASFPPGERAGRTVSGNSASMDLWDGLCWHVRGCVFDAQHDQACPRGLR